jgi:hypothetical protein
VIGQAEEGVDFPLIWLYHQHAIGPVHLGSTIIGVRCVIVPMDLSLLLLPFGLIP